MTACTYAHPRMHSRASVVCTLVCTPVLLSLVQGRASCYQVLPFDRGLLGSTRLDFIELICMLTTVWIDSRLMSKVTTHYLDAAGLTR
jgi:hypothetical protein